MSRGLSSFLVFVGVLAVAGVIATLWIGSELTQFALDGERRNTPLALVSFTRLESGADAHAYGREVLELLDAQLVAQAGEVVWRGTTSQVLDGGVADEWDFVSLTRMAQGAAFLEMITSPEYRDLQDRADAQRQQEITYIVEDLVDLVEVDTLVAYLVDQPDDTAAADGIDLMASTLRRHGGHEVWRSRLTALLGDDGSWNMLLMYRFDTAAGLRGWLEDPERSTVTAIARSKVKDHRLLVIVRG